MKWLTIWLLVVLLFLGSPVAGGSAHGLDESLAPVATPISFDFENLTDLTVVGDQYASDGVAFTGATILSQGGSLNYLGFPPHSGVNVIYDDPAQGGVITLVFDHTKLGKVTSVGGYVTGNRVISLEIYDALGNLLAQTATSGPNYGQVGAPNELIRVSSSTAIARAVFHDGGNTFTVDDLFFESERLCQVTNVPLYKQCGSGIGNQAYGGTTANPWKYDDDGDGRTDEDPKNNLDDDHDGRSDEDTPETICKWGCAMTSAAMVVSYYGQRQNGFTTDPVTLNSWLKEHGGYSSGSLDWDAVARYALDNGVTLSFYAGWGPNDGTVNAYLCHDSPMILNTYAGVYSGGHFLVATGQNSSSLWATNDPGGGNFTQLGANSYVGFRKYGPALTDPTALYIAVHSPIELLITDPAGRKTGYDEATGTYVNQILDASYERERIGAQDGSDSRLETLAFHTGAPLSGSYTVQVMGTGAGAYELDIRGTNRDGKTSTASLSGAVADASAFALTVDYSSEPGVPVQLTLPPNTAPQVDAGGPLVAFAGQSVLLDASKSTDSDANPLVYRWDVDGDGVWDLDWSDQAVTAYTYYRAGRFTVRVEVSDGLASATAETTASITGKLYLPLTVHQDR